MDTDTHAPRDTRDVRVAQSLLRLGASVVVSATLPLSDLIALAQQADERDTMLTLRGASERMARCARRGWWTSWRVRACSGQTWAPGAGANI